MSTRLLVILVAVVVLLPAKARADGYAHQTLTADGIGVGLLVAGGFAEGDRGRNTAASDTLFASGTFTLLLAAPIVHGGRGHGRRAVTSLLMRGGLASVGMSIAVIANSSCDGFLCGLDYAGYGFVGGLVAAALIDAAYYTDEPDEPASWAPRVAVGSGGASVGAAFAW